MSNAEIGFRAAVLALGALLIATGVLVHVKVGPKHKDTDFGAGTGFLTGGLVFFGALCVIAASDGAK